MSKGTIVFLAVNASYSHTNLAGWYLRGYAETAGWNWHEVEITQNDPLSAALQRVTRLNPDILAASFYIFNHHFLHTFISRFKTLNPGCLVIGGGPEFLDDNRDCLERHREIDAVIRGEGEKAFGDWLKHCRQPEQWRNIKGLCAFRDGQYCDNGRAEETRNLDDIPSPYASNLAEFKKPFLLLETSRGCSGQCAFCTSAGERVRFFSLERVRHNLALIARGGVAEARIADRTFNENEARGLALLKMMRAEFNTVRFHLEIDPARLSDEMIQELGRAEPERFHLEIGLQTTRAEVLRDVGRSGAVERSLATLKQLCQMPNLAIHVDLVAGLPGATLADLYADLRATALLEPDEIQLELLKVLPGTRLSRDKEKYNIVSAGALPYEIMRTATMSFDDLVSAQKLSNLVDWFYNAPELQEVLSAAIKIMPSFFEQFCDFCGDTAGAGHAPALENRFRLLEQFFRRQGSTLIAKLGYAWLKHGLSAQHGICRATPWKKPLPPEAVLVEGDPGLKHARIYRAELDRPYLFVYGQQPRRRACAVYALQKEH